ncbi:putative cyclin-dependent serine/threonine-protein kinase DDB_G0272797/DDB_G0274007 [Schistocerca americana]|uniref:putative cyclin-dependent serine/threonine-protein kinase DDB_G0272797/DDB_G0274007 n=1 Tax=Schistocerca americana TaxID=7009 RepID=UPI001F4F7210|nr:putative cyclin-dependent serine/threonine-protein kinase DDB_G0272797/DDB_G0274007 [Schistocerca americana]
MAASVSKRLSLVEQKRIQWAKEREELAGLCAPWGLPAKDTAEIFRSSIRTHFASAAAAADHLKARRQQQEEQLEHQQQQLQHQQQQLLHQQQLLQQQQQQTSPGAGAGLPPIPGARAGDSQESQAECSCREDEGDTSGYGSEANDCALHPRLHHRRLQRTAFWDAAARRYRLHTLC